MQSRSPAVYTEVVIQDALILPKVRGGAER